MHLCDSHASHAGRTATAWHGIFQFECLDKITICDLITCFQMMHACCVKPVNILWLSLLYTKYRWSSLHKSMNLPIYYVPIARHILLRACNQGNVKAWFLYQKEAIMRFLPPYHWRVGDHCNDGFNDFHINEHEN